MYALGLSLALTGIVRYNTLTLYQYHIVYDSISFVRYVVGALLLARTQTNGQSISNCAAMSFVGRPIRRMISRIVLVVTFFILYIVFVVLFGIRLRSWDETQAGYCYDTTGIATPNAAHPMVDEVYLALTCLYMYTAYGLVADAVLFDGQFFHAYFDATRGNNWNELYARIPARYRSYIDRFDNKSKGILSILLPGLRGSQPADAGFWDRMYQKIIKRRPSFSKHEATFRIITKILTRSVRPTYDLSPVLILAMLQLPLHLYFLIRLRVSNEPLLQEGSTENEWGFGQIYALISSAAILTECVRSFDGKCGDFGGVLPVSIVMMFLQVSLLTILHRIEYRMKRNKLLHRPLTESSPKESTQISTVAGTIVRTSTSSGT